MDKYSFGFRQLRSRFEENRIFGAMPLRYLQLLFGCVWDDKWTSGYSEVVEFRGVPIHLTVSESGTVKTKAGVFEDCLKLTITSEKDDLRENYYFEDHLSNTWCGIKEYWFARGVGIVKFYSTWGKSLCASLELSEYNVSAADESYIPVYIGSRWVYEERGLTDEGYIARSEIEVLCGMNGKYLAADSYEFIYRGTETEYEAFKTSSATKNSGI
jgi:hypothetical protein